MSKQKNSRKSLSEKIALATLTLKLIHEILDMIKHFTE